MLVKSFVGERRKMTKSDFFDGLFLSSRVRTQRYVREYICERSV